MKRRTFLAVLGLAPVAPVPAVAAGKSELTIVNNTGARIDCSRQVVFEGEAPATRLVITISDHVADAMNRPGSALHRTMRAAKMSPRKL